MLAHMRGVFTWSYLSRRQNVSTATTDVQRQVRENGLLQGTEPNPSVRQTMRMTLRIGCICIPMHPILMDILMVWLSERENKRLHLTDSYLDV